LVTAFSWSVRSTTSGYPGAKRSDRRPGTGYGVSNAGRIRFLHAYRCAAVEPLHQLDKVETRHSLDKAFMTDVLGFSEKLPDLNGAMQLLRMKLALERHRT
jgi:hypothetical protein